MNHSESEQPRGTVEESDPTPVLAALALVVGTSALPFTGYLPSSVSYIVVLAAYLVFACVVVASGQQLRLAVPGWALLMLGSVWLIYLGHLFVDIVQGPINTEALVRVPPFVLLTGVNLFFIPQVVTRRGFFAIIARISAALVVIGLPTLFVDSYTLLVIDVVSIRGESIPFTSAGRNVVSSIFLNPNTMSYVTLLGFLTALGEFVETHRRVPAMLTVINGSGLYLAHGRSSMLAGVAGVCLFGLYMLGTKRTFRAGYILGGISGIYVILAVFGYIPGPSFITNVNVTGRPVIWAGGVRAILEQPTFGYGAGETGEFLAPFISGKYSGYTPHNSYLRVFVETGVVGGIAYLMLVGRTLFSRLFGELSVSDLTTLVLCSAIAVSMIFRGYTLFGFSIASLIAAITFGYGIKPTDSGEDQGIGTDEVSTGSTRTPHAE
ncbi:O-antigen ligase family protein [Halorientalis halophila]|uniref:O-antigen ligase family protein n=1 Tax=Halorientalis halophila TaxID=3108499 RepID=UPI00300A54B4